jgi:WhiB family transcriptional regulator, redox-sensing transcriptional regulator
MATGDSFFDTGWMGRGVCQDLSVEDKEQFFASTARGQEQAAAHCARCPVQQRCLSFAVETRQQFGVWGGRTERQLRALVRQAALERGRDPNRCRQGHLLEGVNLRVYGKKRECLACARERMARRRSGTTTHGARNQAQAPASRRSIGRPR